MPNKTTTAACWTRHRGPGVSLGVMFVALLLAAPCFSAPAIEADVCVYGGTSGGVIAAAQAARLGKKAVLIGPGRHLGGMSSGGLSWTDVGHADRMWVLGGMTREFYQRVGKHYGQSAEKVFDPLPSKDPARNGLDFAKPPSLSFEPKLAEKVFGEMISEAGVVVHLGSRLKSVHKERNQLVQILTEEGLSVRANIFIDATYEGDLMAMAGVTFTLGREANSQYGETANGVQGPARSERAGKFEFAVDPFKSPGQPASGLLPYLVQAGSLGQPGGADKLIQSYNYRVCLTDVPANRLPIEPPPKYDPANFELLARWVQARIAAGKRLTLRDFLKYDPLQNGKFDFNNRWAISTDMVGGAHGYPEADAAGRERIARAHEHYLRGFFHFLATSPSVPHTVREEMSRFGLCRDEFTDTGGWPHQLYVREARRMVSDFVMTEHHCVGTRLAPHPVGFGAYGIDMHATRRIAHQGQAVNEGTYAPSVPAPYPIGYGAIVPKQSECENLFVTFALSASHVAFGSIRMEPTFMILSQSAAAAAVESIDKKVPVQKVNYDRLAAKLKHLGQVLDNAQVRSAPASKQAGLIK